MKVKNIRKILFAKNKVKCKWSKIMWLSLKIFKKQRELYDCQTSTLPYSFTIYWVYSLNFRWCDLYSYTRNQHMSCDLSNHLKRQKLYCVPWVKLWLACLCIQETWRIVIIMNPVKTYCQIIPILLKQ